VYVNNIKKPFKRTDTNILKINSGHIKFHTGILAKESGGSQVYYLEKFENQEAKMEDIKSKIAELTKVIDINKIQLWDEKNNKEVDIDSNDYIKKGVVMFKMSKIIARDYNGGRELLFPGL